MKRSLGALAALALAAGIFATSTPAQADPPREKYYVVNSLNGDNLHDWFWIDELEGIIGCPRCGWLLDYNKSHDYDPANEAAFQDGLMGGLAKLSEAKIASDPRYQASLKAEAMVRFSEAARALGAASVRPGVVGFYDPDKRANVPAYRAWLAAADQDIVDGLALLQRAASEPAPLPWIEAAQAQFEEAYQELSSKKAIGA